MTKYKPTMGEELNFNVICRICLNESIYLKDLFESDATTPLSYKVADCASIQVTQGDGFPSSICEQCSKNLLFAYDFRTLCRQSDFKLRQQVLYKKNDAKAIFRIVLHDINPPDINKVKLSRCSTKVRQLNLKDPSNAMVIFEGENTTVVKQIKTDARPKVESRLYADDTSKRDFTDMKHDDSSSDDEYFSDDACVNGSESMKDEPEDDVGNYYVVNDIEMENMKLSAMLPPPKRFESVKYEFREEDGQSYSCTIDDIDIEHMKLSAPLPPTKRRRKIREEIRNESQDTNDEDSDWNKSDDEFLKETARPKQKKYELKELDYDMDMPLVPLGPKPKRKPEYKKKQCQVCGKMTTGLKLHMLIHLGIKEFKCEYCSKAFTQRIQYQRHLNIHTGNKPFVCNLCGKAFADSTSLRCHNVTHTKERKYKCDVCDKAFGYSHTLTAHKRTHTQDRKHICSLCQRPFLTRHGLKKHFRIHTGEKPYKCEFCEKRFSTTGNIQTHRRIHTRERPYTCDICQMNFAYRSVLNTHVKIHQK